MNDTIDRIYRHSMNWQKPLLWLRINFGYMRSEIGSVTGAGEDFVGLKQAVGQLEEALASFARSEIWLFEEACTSDRSPHMSSLLGMQRPLFAMRNTLEASVNALEQEIKFLPVSHLRTRPFPLCSRCIEEICKAHGQVRVAIDEVVSTIDANVA